jgi:lipoyl(octanoyl) transferase
VSPAAKGCADPGVGPMVGPGVMRLIVHPPMEGRMDMAIDEAIAEAVGTGESPAVVRLYGFSPATLSLGRFQRVKGAYRPERLAEDGVTLVRRPTGGHAVLHDRELTYSVALAKSESGSLIGASRKRDVYMFIARVLLHGLAHLGIAGLVNSSQKGDVHNPDCFGSAGEYEIAARDGRKLIGSAQMTTRNAVLQHGSIPLENPGRRVFRYLTTPEPEDSHPPTCLNEQAGRALAFDEVQAAFARAFRECLGAEVSTLSTKETNAAERIFSSKYATDEWNLNL